MLTDSNVNFFDNRNGMVVQFKTSELDSTILESILGGNTGVDIDGNKVYLVSQYDKYHIALLYNVDLIDARAGWLFQKMCMTSEKLGFIITPMTRWHRHRIIECYKAIKGNLYRAYFNINKLEEGLIYLIIDWTDFSKS